jgi:hypothetical protein
MKLIKNNKNMITLNDNFNDTFTSIIFNNNHIESNNNNINSNNKLQ